MGAELQTNAKLATTIFFPIPERRSFQTTLRAPCCMRSCYPFFYLLIPPILLPWLFNSASSNGTIMVCSGSAPRLTGTRLQMPFTSGIAVQCCFWQWNTHSSMRFEYFQMPLTMIGWMQGHGVFIRRSGPQQGWQCLSNQPGRSSTAGGKQGK